jgi:hypothetical protein
MDLGNTVKTSRNSVENTVAVFASDALDWRVLGGPLPRHRCVAMATLAALSLGVPNVLVA